MLCPKSPITAISPPTDESVECDRESDSDGGMDTDTSDGWTEPREIEWKKIQNVESEDEIARVKLGHSVTANSNGGNAKYYL